MKKLLFAALLGASLPAAAASGEVCVNGNLVEVDITCEHTDDGRVCIEATVAASASCEDESTAVLLGEEGDTGVAVVIPDAYAEELPSQGEVSAVGPLILTPEAPELLPEPVLEVLEEMLSGLGASVYDGDVPVMVLW